MKKTTVTDYKHSCTINFPYDFRFMVIGKWHLADFILLLRTQPEMPHKAYLRNSVVEKTFNLHRKNKNQNYNVIRNGFLAQLSNCHESLYSMEILESRIRVGKIILLEREQEILTKYFNRVREWVRNIKKQADIIIGDNYEY